MKLLAFLLVVVSQHMVVGMTDIPGEEIMKVLEKILKRLDVMDGNYNDLKKTVDSNYKDLKKTVVSNKDALFNLEIHVRGVQMTLKEVTKRKGHIHNLTF